MSGTNRDGRCLLVKQVRATGEYIAEHADELVDAADLKTDFAIGIEYAADDIPIIRVEQAHAMRNVIDVINEEDRKRRNGG